METYPIVAAYFENLFKTHGNCQIYMSDYYKAMEKKGLPRLGARYELDRYYPSGRPFFVFKYVSLSDDEMIVVTSEVTYPIVEVND